MKYRLFKSIKSWNFFFVVCRIKLLSDRTDDLFESWSVIFGNVEVWYLKLFFFFSYVWCCQFFEIVQDWIFFCTVWYIVRTYRHKLYKWRLSLGVFSKVMVNTYSRWRWEFLSKSGRIMWGLVCLIPGRKTQLYLNGLDTSSESIL